MPLVSESADAHQCGSEGGGNQDQSDKVGSGGKKGRGNARSCPICGKPEQAATRPFCSKRCRDVDLNRWLSGSYVVPGAETEDEGSE